jgi:hypothetical protein
MKDKIEAAIREWVDQHEGFFYRSSWFTDGSVGVEGTMDPKGSSSLIGVCDHPKPRGSVSEGSRAR